MADTVTQRRNDILRRLKAENKAAEELLRGKTFGELLQEFNVSVVAESITGTAKVEKIEAFKWSEKKHQGRTYPNTFVIVRFSNEAGPVTEEEDEITIVVGDEVIEAAPDTKENITIEASAPVVEKTAEAKKDSMSDKLNRVFGKKEAVKPAAPIEVVPVAEAAPAPVAAKPAAPANEEELKVLSIAEPPFAKEGWSQDYEGKLVARTFSKEIKEILALGWNFRFVQGDAKAKWVISDTRFGVTVGRGGATQKEALQNAIDATNSFKAARNLDGVQLSNWMFDHATKNLRPLVDLFAEHNKKEEPVVKTAPAAPVVVVEAEAAKPTSRCVGNFAIAGLQHSPGAHHAEELLIEGAKLKLKRNVTHSKDQNAVEIHVGNDGWCWVGYVPKETAARLAPRMDIGVEAWAVITGWEHGYPRFDLFLGKTPTPMETFNYQRDEIDRAGDTLVWLEGCVFPNRETCHEYLGEKAKAQTIIAHFAALCGSIKL